MTPENSLPFFFNNSFFNNSYLNNQKKNLIYISFYSFIDGLAFTTGEIGTALLIASFTGVVIQATFLTTVRKLNKCLTIVIKF